MAIEEFYETRSVDNVLVVKFRSPQILDAMTIGRISAGLKELVAEASHDRFAFDFSTVNYLSSSALGMLIGLHRKILQGMGQLKLAGIRDEIMEVFGITKLDTVFDIYKNTDAALEAFRKNL